MTGSKDRFNNFSCPGDLVGTEGDWREEYPDYLGYCWSLDQNVGRLREELARLGLADCFGLAFYKAQTAMGSSLPKDGTVLITVVSSL